ncbi:bifunctional diguanylate cyclase/phosphodiesterase [Sphingomonas sp. SORGH_AS_0879]|uniref:putative bifunctional diguanylate cyclase/phosphodiesterase n=1 Tax=Sphingomonas sp. SORGH_AS_0879 TaxID=3041790 RepID=UPI0027844A60|nr:EAL domain-containing protein [Sphingomonas sp. SORGH_AS_0879]MDQ1230248.1 diguanylate cyclase (GGDEF)-like protein [Sphingomonas sp. SORGH_AS_0879]
MSGSHENDANTDVSARLLGVAVAGGTFLLAAAILLIELGFDLPAKLLLFTAATASTVVYWRLPALQLRHRAAPDQRDPLTGLVNRRFFHDSGQSMIDAMQRRKRGVALLLLDIDRFRAFAGSFGHEAGDSLLQHVAKTIRAEAPSEAIVARFESDCFGCLLSFDPRARDRIDRLADRLAIRLGQPIRFADQEFAPRTAIALTRIEHGEATIDQLVRQADLALITAKTRGDGKPLWFEPAMENAMAERNVIITDLRAALADSDICPRFQPQVDLGTGRLTGFEVSGHWEHPTLGPIAADRFLPVAEACGLSGEVTLSLMRQAMAGARDWDPSIILSVPMVASQFQDAWLAQKIIKTLTECGFPAHRLEIEITENALFANLALAQSIVTSLKNQGISLALDHFGSGQSSLAHLRVLPFDRVRIDPDFIRNMSADPDCSAIVSAIVQLGDNLHLPIAAKGLRDAETEARLREIGCSHGQGPLYGPMLDLAQVRQMLAEKRLLAGAAAPAPPFTSPRLAG